MGGVSGPVTCQLDGMSRDVYGGLGQVHGQMVGVEVGNLGVSRKLGEDSGFDVPEEHSLRRASSDRLLC